MFSMIYLVDDELRLELDDFTRDEIYKYRVNGTPEEFCRTKNAKKFLDLFLDIWDYKFDEEPNYNKILFLLAKIIIEKNSI
jgi:hypothetical protein